MNRIIKTMAPIVIVYLLIVAYAGYRTNEQFQSQLDGDSSLLPVPTVAQIAPQVPATILESQKKSASVSQETPKSQGVVATSASQAAALVATPTIDPASALGSNPGTSMTPLDLGKIIESDAFKVKLLDVRKDTYEYKGQNASQTTTSYIYKFEIVSKMQAPYAFSGTEFSVKAGTPSSPRPSSPFSYDFTYPSDRIGANLASNEVVISPGQSLIGYYVEALKVDETEPTSMYISVLNIGYNPTTKKLDALTGSPEAGVFIVR